MNERPLQRVDGLVITDSGDDLLVYDTTSHALHTLNELTAKVFRRCNGTATIDDLARETGVDKRTVRLAIELLREAGLLDHTSLTGLPAVTSRRRFLRKAGIAAIVSAIVSVTAPLASGAQSVTCNPSGTPCEFSDPGACCSLICVNANPVPVCV